MGRRIRWLLVVPTLMVALGAATACSGSDGGSELPTGGGASTTQGSTAPSASGEYAQALAFTKCMREHGLPDFPDPKPDGSLDAGANVDRASTQYKNAMEACKDLAPGGTAQNGVDSDQVAQMTKYAKCMRDNGMSDFPDPGPNGFEPGALDPDAPGFAEASKACQEFLTWR